MISNEQKKTRAAILGKPCKQFDEDIKLQGTTKNEISGQGEIQAQAALTAELLVLDVAQVPRSEQQKYRGRSQYPRLKLEPICRQVSEDHEMSKDLFLENCETAWTTLD